MKIKTKYEGITDFMRAAVDSDLTRLMEMLCSTPNVAEELLRKDGKGRTALDWARISRNYLAITLILKVVSNYIHDSRVERLSSIEDFQKCLIEANRKQSRKLLAALKERDVASCLEILMTNQLVREEIEALGEVYFVDRAGALGYTPLMLAAGLNMADVVRILADAKAPINQANRFGHTALTIATCAGNADVTEYLLFKEADLYHSTAEKRTALHYACLYKKAKIVKIFFDYLLERFSVFRVEGHPLIDFDPSRWTIYVDMLKNLCNLKDVTGRTAKELLGEEHPDGQLIERRLRLSGGRGISKLEDIHKEAEDFESIVTNFSEGLVTQSQPVAVEGRAQAAEHEDQDNEDNFVEDPHEEDEESDTISEVTLQTGTKLELKSIPDPLNFDNYINHDLNEDNISSKFENLKGDVDVVSASSNQWSHDTDNLHAENLWEMYSVKTALPHEEEVKCILSCFEMVHERIGQWLDRAGKEQDLIQLVPCVLNCGKMITRERMQEHIRDECDLRTVQCLQCHRIIVQKLLEEHMRKDCLRRTVVCPNAYQGCGAFLTPEELEFHLKLQCDFRLVLCKQYCQVSVPYKYYDLHEKEHCRNRMIVCDQCRSPMVAHEYSNHLTTTCPMRKVKCSVGCGEWFCLKDIKQHEEEVCQRFCKHAGCTTRLGPPAKLIYHETTECDYRPASCRYLNCGCERLDIIHKYKAYHESFLCSVRPVMCSLGCGNSINACEMDFHHRYKCSERRVRCPSNYVGWKITLPSKTQSAKKSLREGAVLKYCRQNNRDELYVRFEDGHEWIHALDPSLVFVSKVDINGGSSSKGKGHVDDHFSCGWLVYNNLEAHLLYHCPQRVVKLTLEDQKLELTSLTTVQNAPNIALSLEKLESDVANFRANNDVVTCSHCGLICSKAALNAHENDDCQEITLFCPIGCGSKVKRKDINEHVEKECGKRVVVCPQCHVDDLWAEELSAHLKDQCPSRVISCRNFCGVADLMAKDEINHLMRSCPMRLLQCECGLMVAAKDFDSHKLFHCNERIISCPQGCGAKITFNQRDNHINFSCSQRYLYRFAQRVECPNGCGESMLRRELLEHVTYLCNKRVVECPQLCGNNVQLDRLPTHLTFCPKRVICCEPGVKMCAKPLHEWFYKGVEIVNTGNNGLMTWSKAVLGEKSQIEEEASETKGSLLADETRSASVILDNDVSKRKTTVVESVNSLKAPALFSGSNIHISLTDNSSSTFLDKLRVAHSTSAEDDDNGSMNSSSSIYYDGIAMKFRENIRMLTCEKHNMNAFMAAIRCDDEALAEYIIKQVQESADIDQENVYGDTALTLACRTGKLRFVELLVQHGADLNKETFNGRTALIEAVKSPLENLSMIEYLLKEGCMVSYKTARHGRTALDWARRYNTGEIQAYEEKRRNQLKRLEKRRSASNQTMKDGDIESREEEELLMDLTEEQKRLMGRPRTVRVLELAHLVQQQCNLMFQKIATGDTDYIINIIKDGDFFDVRNEEKAYAAMDKHLLLAQQADQDIVAVQQKMYGLSDKIDLAQAKYKDCLKALQEAEERLESTHHIEVAADGSINKYFTIYEKAAAKLSTVDIEEINRVHEPTSLLLTSLYTFGLVFDLFDVESEGNGPIQSFRRMNSSAIGVENSYQIGNQSLTYDQIQSSRGQWLPVIKRQMLKSIDTLRLIQTFSRAKLHVERHQKLFARIKQLLDVFCMLADGEIHNFPMSLEDSLVGGWPLSGSGSVNASRSNSPKERKRLINMGEQPSRPLSGLDFQSVDQRESVATPLSFAGGTEGDRVTSAPLSEEYFLEAPISRGEETGAVADYEWDSDAEDPDGGGYWSKGEWVSVSRKRNNWWDRQSNTSNAQSFRETGREMIKHQNSKLVVITQDLIQEEKEKTLKAMQKENSRSALLSASKEGVIMEEDLVNNTINPVINQPLNASLNAEELEDGSISRGKRDVRSGGGLSSRNGSPRSRKAKQRRGRRHQSSKDSRRKNRQLDDREGRTYDHLQIPLGEDEESVGSIFADIMLHLIRAIHVYSSDFEVLVDKKQKTLQAAAQVDELKQQLQEALDRYNKEFTYRANLEQAYIKGLKNSKFHRDKVALHTNKVRICRLLNYVCVNGHTAVSYAASYGNYTLVEEMLSRGATVGYTADVLLQVIRFLQLSWRIYRLTVQAREHLKQTNAKGKNLRVSAAEMQNLADDAVVTGGNTEEEESKTLNQHKSNTAINNSDPLQLFTSSRAHYLNFIRQIEELKEERKKILTLMIFNRQKIRLPIPEALYAGNWEIVQRIYERKLWHMYFTSTFTFPLPRFPFLRQSEYQYSHEKISIQDVMTHGLNYLSSGAYSSQEGWLPPGHEREPYGEMLQEINRILSEINERNMKTIKAKQRLRLIITSKKNMEKYEKKLLQLIYSRSFKEAMELVIARGINVDLETVDGQTLLIAAAEENANAVNHIRILNDELKPVLIVEYLLDRFTYRPNINYESKIGLTALIRACILGREDVVVALLNRGAAINYLNKFHKAALHYATLYGHGHIVKLLLERLVDVQVKDGDGKTAYNLAEELNFIDIMTLLSQYASGNYGALCYSRGEINNFVSCPLGCGVRLLNYMKAQHTSDECECRFVNCPNGCGASNIMHKELGRHLSSECPRRMIQCDLCSEMVVQEDLPDHKVESCPSRLVHCPNKGCGKELPFQDIELHLRICSYKLIPCPLMCNSYIQEIVRDNHVKNACVNRRVPCPQKCRNMIIFKFLAEHMTNVCPRRMLACPLCATSLEKQELERHINSACVQRDIPCPNNCGQMIRCTEINRHLQEECCRRIITCPLHCQLDIEARFLPKHMDKDCANRMVSCKFRCVDRDDLPEEKQVVNTFPAKIVNFHERYDCPNRLVSCFLCKKSDVVYKKKLNHELYHCPKRVVPCPHSEQGCGRLLPRDEVANHLATECKFRDVLCPLGCGRYLPYHEKLSHVENSCEQRYIACPLQCGEQIKVISVMTHITEDCARRHFTKLCYGADATTKPNQKSKKKLLISPSSSSLTEEAPKDVNSLLSSLSVVDLQAERPTNKKAMLRREETMRVMHIRKEMRFNSDLRSKLIDAIQSSSGAQMTEQPLLTQTKP